jgi:hypothetical protein
VIGDIMGGLVAEHVVSRSVRDTAVLEATALVQRSAILMLLRLPRLLS